MAYQKTEWKARQGTGTNRFLKSQETDTEVYLTNAPLEITEPGTAMSPDNLNHMEDGIEAAHEAIEAETLAREQGDGDAVQAAAQAISEHDQDDAAHADIRQLISQSGGGGGIGTVVSVDGVGPDSSGNIALSQRVSKSELEALYDNPSTAVPGRVYEYPEIDEHFINEYGLDGLIELIKEQVEENILEREHPVNSFFESTDPTNPAEFLPGTWTLWGPGRVSVCIDESQPEFDEVEKEGGEKEHLLTAAQSGLVGHNHLQNSHTHPVPVPVSSSWTVSQPGGLQMFVMGSVTSGGTTATNIAATAIDATQAHNNLQPYKTLYKFKRIA